MNTKTCIFSAVAACIVIAATSCSTTPEINRSDVGPSSLWLEPPRVSGSKVFFPDELDPIADAVAEVLARPPHDNQVVPPEVLRTLWARTQRGDGFAGASPCEAKPPPAKLAKLIHPDATSVSIDLHCREAGCVLAVEIRPDRDSQPRKDRYLVISLPVGEGPRAWAERIRRDGLQPAPAPKTGMGGLGVRRPSQESFVSVDSSRRSGPWSTGFDDERFRGLFEPFAACEPPGAVWMDAWSAPFLIEVSEEGRVSRCESPYPDHIPPPGFGCKCDVLGTIDFGKGQPGRRASLGLRIVRADKKTRPKPGELIRVARLEKLSATDPSALLGWRMPVDAQAVDRCLEPLDKPRRDLLLPVQFHVGADGRPKSHRFVESPGLPDDVVSCLETSLGESRFTCPLTGEATIDGVLRLLVRKVKATPRALPGGATSP